MRKTRKSKTKNKSRNRSLFSPFHHKKYAEIITFRNPDGADGASKELEKEFKSAKTKTKKLRIIRVLIYASNRAEASAKRRNLSRSEKNQLLEISRIYKRTADKLLKIYNKL